MINRPYKTWLLIIASICFVMHSNAQKRFALGVGASFVNGAEEKDDLYAFVPVTLYFSYSFINTPSTRVAIENFTSFRLKDDGNEIRNGFAMTLPITFEYRISKWSLYTGVGPAYVNQSVEYKYVTKQKEHGDFLDINAGLGKRTASEKLTGEIGVRLHYLKRFSGIKEDGFMLSFYISGPK
ncbi:hypothetical protein [Flavisolibacter tropicus]|uniref:Outer membrane protein beta-barrel domain-containing protein n=1 Tax=Flavisolibacter tropicus TaxID=1492898 RepID=A0A172U1X6_9BACT|nr:hypothetical protein [Flavisolibacter tropicus]ANE53124.1 hypothetical protein SY85_24280 [Flavisolibacter tropicus]